LNWTVQASILLKKPLTGRKKKHRTQKEQDNGSLNHGNQTIRGLFNSTTAKPQATTTINEVV